MDQTKKELLLSAGVDLSGALERFMDNEKLYDNYLRRFAANTSFADLQTALDAQDWENALAISHNLKGTTGSLGFTQLYKYMSEQVAMLRRDDNAGATALMADIMPEYERLLDVAKQVI